MSATICLSTWKSLSGKASIFLVAYPSMSNNGIWIVKGQTDAMPHFKVFAPISFPVHILS